MASQSAKEAGKGQQKSIQLGRRPFIEKAQKHESLQVIELSPQGTYFAPYLIQISCSALLSIRFV
jgi:hypothetical protein